MMILLMCAHLISRYALLVGESQASEMQLHHEKWNKAHNHWMALTDTFVMEQILNSMCIGKVHFIQDHGGW
jgi:hypothetical protein